MLFNKFEGRKHWILNVREQSIKHDKSGRIIVVVIMIKQNINDKNKEKIYIFVFVLIINFLLIYKLLNLLLQL